jgi:hypothetical protein
MSPLSILLPSYGRKAGPPGTTIVTLVASLGSSPPDVRVYPNSQLEQIAGRLYFTYCNFSLLKLIS